MAVDWASSTIEAGGTKLHVRRAGRGRPVLVLHHETGTLDDLPFYDALAANYEVIVPHHPGYSRSERPDWMRSVRDIAVVYRGLLSELTIGKPALVGLGFGGWIAAEMATKSPERIRRLVMIGPVGVKVGSPDKLDIPDVFAMSQDDASKLLFHDPVKMKVDQTKLTDDELTIMFRNRETLALLVWEPWMHNPKLMRRLHRAAMPALFIRGASDGLVSDAYMSQYAKLLPNARTHTIPAAGHAPQLEQPEKLASAVLDFLEK
jgi:pimeloyl-ACP methyl ester carboxylesterase